MPYDFFCVTPKAIALDYLDDTLLQLERGRIALACRSSYEALIAALTAKLDDSTVNFHAYEKPTEHQKHFEKIYERLDDDTDETSTDILNPPKDHTADMKELIKRCKKNGVGRGPPIVVSADDYRHLYKLKEFRNALAHPKPVLDMTHRPSILLKACSIASALTSFLLVNCALNINPEYDDEEVHAKHILIDIYIENQLSVVGCDRNGALYEN